MMRTYRYCPPGQVARNSDADADDDDESGSTDEDDSDDDEDSSPRQYIRIIGEDVSVDCNSCVIVLVFPRGVGHGGGSDAVDPNEDVLNPEGAAARIFRSHMRKPASFLNLPEGPNAKISQRLYQQQIRNAIIAVLLQMDFQLSSFESIDGDETFLKVSVEPDAPIVRHLAKSFRYRMPFRPEAYQTMKPFAGHPGSAPPLNMNKEEVYAYHEFEDRLVDKLQPFRNVDIIRLVTRIISQHISLYELERQRIVSRTFVAARSEQVVELNEKWLKSLTCFWHQTCHDEDLVRDYFGEEVAFYFQYFAFYIRMLSYLSFFTFLLMAIDAWVGRLVVHSWLKIAFGVCLVIWATFVQDNFEHQSARSRQKWGMDETNQIEPTLPTYKPELEGTRRLWVQKMCSNLCVVGACLLFSVLWGVVSVKGRGSWESIGTSMLIRIFSIAWSLVIPKVVRLCNHRTLRRQNKSMVAKLGLVKLFLYLSPFLRTAFVVNWSQMTCGENLHAAAEKAFVHGWPTGVNKTLYRQWLPQYTVPMDRKLHRRILGLADDAGTCIWGCRPATCVKDRGPTGTAGCRTNCYYTLRESLDYLFLSHVGFSLLFVLIALAQARYHARSEIKKATKEDERYTYLQFQAKCDEVARYEYASWGGSFVEDMLEVVLSFAMVACFGIMQPFLAPIALVAASLEFRLIAYRMTHVTARPYPTPADGIEMWQRLLNLVVVMSALVNAGLAVFLLPPFDRWSPSKKVMMFLGYGYVMLGGRGIVQSMFRKRPTDVVRIEDFNHEFLARMAREKNVPRVKNVEVSPTSPAVDIGLERPLGSDSYLGSWNGQDDRLRSFSLFNDL